MARGGGKGSAGATPGEPRWLLSAGLAALATALVCWPAWPGYMSYDSLLAYSQAVHGVDTALWPPLHAYLFALSRKLGAGTWGLFVAQTFVLLGAGNLVLSLLARRTWLAAALMLGFLASFVWFTPQLGVLQTQWRDVTTTTFALLGLALWLLGARYRRLSLALAGALAFGGCLALRYNAPPLIGPLTAVMVWRPLLAPSTSRPARWLTVGTLSLSVVLAWASTQWRLPDLRRLPPGENAMVTQQFDLIGVSACAGVDALPRAMTRGKPVSGGAIADAYDARHLNLSIAAGAPWLVKLPPTTANGELVGAAWRHQVTTHPGCYLWHRKAVTTEQLGLVREHLFYPTHGAIDDNAYGIKLAHPEAANWLNQKISRGALPMSRRVFWLYIAAAPLVMAAGWRRREQAPLLGAIAAGAYAYVALLFLAGPAADARYIFPSNVFCVLAILGSVAALLPRRLAG